MARLLLAALMFVGASRGVEAQAPTSAETPTRAIALGQSRLMTMLERSTEDTRRVLFFARQEVSEWGAAVIAPEHFLLGIIREGKGPAYELLFEEFALNVTTLKAEIESHIERKIPLPESTEVPFTPSARQVLIAAMMEADRLQEQEIRPEHLLLGMLGVTDSIPAAILSKHGVNLESARERLSSH
jgi:ATP-dependent Clp protease ATP-binding subunit ClpC